MHCFPQKGYIKKNKNLPVANIHFARHKGAVNCWLFAKADQSKLFVYTLKFQIKTKLITLKALICNVRAHLTVLDSPVLKQTCMPIFWNVCICKNHSDFP